MAHQIDHQPTKVLITGKSGSGKSTYYSRFIANTDHSKIFVFDHEGEFSHRTGLRACNNMDELSQEIEKRYIIYDPQQDFPGQSYEAFNFFCEWSFSVCQDLPGKKLFATDELQKLIGTNSLPWELCCVIETGRRAGMDTVFICQQPNLMHNRLRNQLTEIVTFRQIDKRALEFLGDVGFDPEEIKRLDRLEFRLLDLEHGRMDGGKFVYGGKTSVDATPKVASVSPDRESIRADEPPEYSENHSGSDSVE